MARRIYADIYQAERVDRVMDIDQTESEQMMRRLAREEGIFAGVSSGGVIAGALKLSEEARGRHDCGHNLRSR